MILKIGHANANELDTYFPLFSAKRIKGYSTKDKLISQLNQSMADDGINVTDATLVTWESFGYPLMDGVDEEQENGGSLISGANNEACRIVWVQLKHDAQNKLMQPIVQIHPIPRIVNFANHRRWKKTKSRLSRQERTARRRRAAYGISPPRRRDATGSAPPSASQSAVPPS